MARTSANHALRSKVLASGTITLSIIWLAFFSKAPAMVVLGLALGLTALATWLCPRPTPVAAKYKSDI